MAFPHEIPGRSDEYETYVTIETAKILLTKNNIEWKDLLEMLIKLINVEGRALESVITFDMDLGRMVGFVEFWKQNDIEKPKWLIDVLNVLYNSLKDEM